MKRKAGQPTKFYKINLEQLKKLVLSGWDDKQVSDFFRINVASLNNYKKKHLKFFESLKEWKKEADLKVEKCLYKRAIGFNYDEITREPEQIIEYEDGQRVSMKYNYDKLVTNKVITKLIIPDVTAQIFWLKNRQPDVWRDKKEADVLPLPAIQIFVQNIIQKAGVDDKSTAVNSSNSESKARFN